MRKREVEIGGTYTAKISGSIVRVRIDSTHRLGGWNATNLKTNHTVRIKSAQKLRKRVDEPKKIDEPKPKAKRQGRRGRRAKQEQQEQEHPYKPGDRVIMEFDNEMFAGVVQRLKPEGLMSVRFDDGDIETVKGSRAEREPASDDDDEDEEVLQGFNQYPIKWDPIHTHFNLIAEDIKFYGWWRQTKSLEHPLVWAIDLFCTTGDHSYACESWCYYTGDPREKLKSLNADICCAANKFLYQRCAGDVEHLDDLRRRAEKPILHIDRLETIDRIILGLREYRETAIRAGGTRHFEINGDREGESIIHLTIDLTQQAAALEGRRPPSLTEGALLDNARSGDDGDISRPIKLQANAGNVEALCEQLDAAKAKGNKSEARKIRATLRKMGHRGGARALRNKK